MPHSQALLDYVKAHSLPEDAFLTDLRQASREAEIPQISISTEQARFMQLLLRLHRAEQVVEVGTLGGYSGPAGLAMKRQLLAREGSLTRIEKDSGADYRGVRSCSRS